MPRPRKEEYNVKDIVSRAAVAKKRAAPVKKPKVEAVEAVETPKREWLEPDPLILDDCEIVIWDQINKHAPKGLITEADRLLLEILCRLMAKMRNRAQLTREEISTMNQLSSRFAMTPKDRANMKVGVEKPEKKANKFEDL